MTQAYDPDLIGAEFFSIGDAGLEPEPKPQDPDSVQAAVTRLIDSAQQHFEQDIQPDLVEATNYYLGREFGDEVDGRSKVVATVVRDATQAQLPQLMRVFTGPDRVVEYDPVGREDAPIAEQMTGAVEWAIHHPRNEGFRTLHSWMKDALVRRLGWVKWWGETMDRVTENVRTNLTDMDVAALVQQFQPNPDIELELEEATSVDAETGQPLHTLRITRFTQAWCPRFEAVPPEEIVYTEGTRRLEDGSGIIAHVRDVPRDELLDMGIPEELLDNAAIINDRDFDSELKDARQHHFGARTKDGTDGDASSYEGHSSRQPIRFSEAYGYFDADGDGIAELRMFQCVGPNHKIVNGEQDGEGNFLGEIVSEIPLAYLTPDPEPHVLAGLSNYDNLKAIQRIMSQVERGQLDSLAAALEPKTEVVNNEVNIKDLTSPEVNGIVRVRKPGMMREITHRFVGPDTLPVLQYYQEVKENRTGISKASAGLNPDALQSSTQAAVAATVSGSQQHIWLIAQVFAETGFRRFFRGMARLIAENIEPGTVIKLRSGQAIPIDPRTWNLEMDMRVDVAVGMGPSTEKIEGLLGILERQEGYLQQGVPFVKFHHIRNTLSRLTATLGYRHDDEFFAPWTEEMQQQYEQQQAEAQAQADPPLDQLILEIERGKVQLQSLEAQLEHERKMRELDLKERELAIQSALKEFDIEAKTGVALSDQETKENIAKMSKAAKGDS